MISDSLKRIDKYNSKGVYLKSYFKKFNSELNQWYPAICFDNEKKCDYSRLGLYQIKIAKEDNDDNENLLDQNNTTVKSNNQNLSNQRQENNNSQENQNFDPGVGLVPEPETQQCEGDAESC